MFTLTSLSEKEMIEDKGLCWFVPAQTFHAITRRHEILEKEKNATIPSSQGGWRLVDELPDIVQPSGIPIMPDFISASRWQPDGQRDPSLVLKRLLKLHEGELVELEGRWERGQGEVPDALFDPQFASKIEDLEFCKRLDNKCERSKYAVDYTLAEPLADRLRRGEGKGKDKGKEQPDVGGTGQPAVGGGGGKGKPAVGGKSQSVAARGLPFESSILKIEQGGTWEFRSGTCMSLACLFDTCGREFTAAQLYAYYNRCSLIASKRPHAWSSPARQVAAIERKTATGRYGHGS